MKQPMKRHTYPSQFRIDPATQDRLVYAKAALAHILGGAKVSQSTIVRRALALYTAHLENTLTNKAETKPQLSRNEGYHIQHHAREQGVQWPGEFPTYELKTPDGSFPRFSVLEKKYREMKPKLNDILAAEAAGWSQGGSVATEQSSTASAEGFKRRAD